MKRSAISDQQIAFGGGQSAVIRWWSSVGIQRVSAFKDDFCRQSARALFFLLTTCCLLLNAYAQTEESPDDASAPPPLKILSKTEKSQIGAAKDMKERTKLALVLMEARLLNAETLGAKEQYPEMFDELGGFHALVDNTLDYLKRNNNDSGKVLNSFKRVELSLRKYITRLELIRRELPVKYEGYVRQLTRDIRDARTAAVEPLFDDSVVRSPKPE